MTTPALRNLKEQTGAKITYLHMFETTRDILLHNPCIDENIHFPFLSAGRLEGLRFLMDFRKQFDCSINFYPSNRRDYNLASFICASPLRIGHRYARNNLTELNFLKTGPSKMTPFIMLKRT
jgi:heptosyltransferase-2